MHIEIPPEERELLLRILKAYQADLRDEIYRTEATGYKRGLKDEQALLERIVQKLEGSTIAA